MIKKLAIGFVDDKMAIFVENVLETGLIVLLYLGNVPEMIKM